MHNRMFKIKKIKTVIQRWMNAVYPMPAHFGPNKLNQREKYKPDYRILASVLFNNLSFESVLDVGCAQGFLLDPLMEYGVNIKGVELSKDALQFTPDKVRPYIEIGDFSEAGGSYDLVCCVEVAEHIKPARSEEIVNKLGSLSKHYIYFTAAPPGQDGLGHINCRPHEEWIELFNQSNYVLNESITKEIRSDLEQLEYAEWLQNNSLLFETLNI